MVAQYSRGHGIFGRPVLGFYCKLKLKVDGRTTRGLR